MSRRILVTGASGFLGRYCIEKLQSLDFEIVGLYKHRKGPAEIRWVQADLLAPGVIKGIVEENRPTHLLHLAWCTKYPEYWTSDENFLWQTATVELLEAFGACGGQYAMSIGTCAEYGSIGDVPFAESASPNPQMPYSKAKQKTCKIACTLADRLGFALCWPRIFYLYGPGEDRNRFIPQLINSLLKGEFVCNSPDKIIDLLYVEDVATRLVALIDFAALGVINIGSGVGISLGEICLTAKALIGPKAHLELMKPSISSSKMVADIRLLEACLGKRLPINLCDGLSQTIGWWKSENHNRHKQANATA